MQIWTTFCPSKITWELTYAQTKIDPSTGSGPSGPTSDWLANKQLISDSLKKLKAAGISGIIETSGTSQECRKGYL